MSAINKNIIITGSEGIVGKSFRNFAEKKGYKIFCVDIKNIRRKNYYKCDITNENSVEKTVKEITKKNKINILINNASYNPKVETKLKKFKFSSYDFNKWKRGIDVDINGSFLLSKHVLKYFEKENKGIILNISSIYGIVGPDQKIYDDKFKKYYGYKPLEYSVAKSAVIGFTKSLAAFYSNTNIKVNCLIFGGIKNKQKKGFIKNYSKKTIIGRMANIGEYNNYIDFFTSEQNSYCTGSCVIIDGGATNII